MLVQVSGRINGVDNISSDTDGTNTRIHIFLANFVLRIAHGFPGL